MLTMHAINAKPQTQKVLLPAGGIYNSRVINVVRDDLIVGGTKQAALMAILPKLDGEEFVYAGPRHGYAQIALAAACHLLGKRCTLFIPASKELHPRSETAKAYGASVMLVKAGRLNVLQSRARVYCRSMGAVLLPFGLDCEAMKIAICERALSLDLTPDEVWSVAGSGTLQRGLQLAWPKAKFYAVQIGKTPRAGRAEVMVAPENYEDPAKEMPPFPSCDNYDAKAWQFLVRHASDRSLFWNVGG